MRIAVTRPTAAAAIETAQTILDTIAYREAAGTCPALHTAADRLVAALDALFARLANVPADQPVTAPPRHQVAALVADAHAYGSRLRDMRAHTLPWGNPNGPDNYSAVMVTANCTRANLTAVYLRLTELITAALNA